MRGAGERASGPTKTYQLLRKRDLVELHLVNASLGGAQQRGGCDQSALHDGLLALEIQLAIKS